MTQLTSHIDFLFKNKYILQDFYIEKMYVFSDIQNKMNILEKTLSEKKYNKKFVDGFIEDIQTLIENVSLNIGSENLYSVLSIFQYDQLYLDTKTNESKYLLSIYNNYFIPLSITVIKNTKNFLIDNEIVNLDIPNVIPLTKKKQSFIEKVEGATIALYIHDEKILCVHGIFRKDSLGFIKKFPLFKMKMESIQKEIDYLNLPDDFKEKQFLVKNINTINDIPSEFTFIPKKLEYFNVEQIKDYLDSTQNLELDEKLTLLKVLIKYEENKILHTLNVNFRMDEMIHLNNFLEQFVSIPNHNQKPYVCDFETFFFMNHHQLLPEDHEAYLDFDPFLAEGYLNAITDTLYIPKDQESSIISILKKDGLDLEPYQKIQLDMFQIQDLKEYGLNSEFFNSTDYIYMGYKDYFNLQIVKMPKIEKITIQSIFNQIKIQHFFVIQKNPNFKIKRNNRRKKSCNS